MATQDEGSSEHVLTCTEGNFIRGVRGSIEICGGNPTFASLVTIECDPGKPLMLPPGKPGPFLLSNPDGFRNIVAYRLNDAIVRLVVETQTGTVYAIGMEMSPELEVRTLINAPEVGVRHAKRLNVSTGIDPITGRNILRDLTVEYVDTNGKDVVPDIKPDIKPDGGGGDNTDDHKGGDDTDGEGTEEERQFDEFVKKTRESGNDSCDRAPNSDECWTQAFLESKKKKPDGGGDNNDDEVVPSPGPKPDDPNTDEGQIVQVVVQGKIYKGGALKSGKNKFNPDAWSPSGDTTGKIRRCETFRDKNGRKVTQCTDTHGNKKRRYGDDTSSDEDTDDEDTKRRKREEEEKEAAARRRKEEHTDDDNRKPSPDGGNGNNNILKSSNFRAEEGADSGTKPDKHSHHHKHDKHSKHDTHDKHGKHHRHKDQKKPHLLERLFKKKDKKDKKARKPKKPFDVKGHAFGHELELKRDANNNLTLTSKRGEWTTSEKVGAVVGVIALISLVVWYWRRRNTKKKEALEEVFAEGAREATLELVTPRRTRRYAA